jgi:beta-glucan synthesis-associated protein KRE6
MVLWRLASVDDRGVLLPPPTLTADQRTSVLSTASGESIWTLSSDSKYPSGPPTAVRGGLVPYAWDPSLDDDQDGADEDDLHIPESADKASPFWNHRGIFNVGVIVLLVGGLLVLFIAYPVITYVEDNSNIPFFEETGTANTVNVPQNDLHIRSLIDPDTPNAAKSRVGYDGNTYNLVFSDEFNLDGRSFNAGDDPFWEAVDLWYWNTGDQEWYDSGQVYTANGSLHVRIDNVATNGMPYRSGMLQSWNKFCFTGGYIEVAASLPGPNDETKGYVSP